MLSGVELNGSELKSGSELRTPQLHSVTTLFKPARLWYQAWIH